MTASVENHKAEADTQALSSAGEHDRWGTARRPGQGGRWWGFSQLSVEQGGGPHWSAGFLVLVWILFLSHSSKLTWEPYSGRCRLDAGPFLLRSSVLARTRETVRPSHTGSHPRPPTLPGGLFSALVVLSLLPPLTTAGSNQSRFTSQGGVERNRGS